MMSRALSRTAVFATTAGLATASLMGAASAKGQPTHLSRTHLTIKSATVRVTKTDKYKATITGTLRSHHAGVAAETVTLDMRSNASKAWTPGPTAPTGTDGKVVFNLTQGTVREQYRLVFAGDTTYKKSHSGVVTVNAAQATS